jgi:hypothetical protein
LIGSHDVRDVPQQTLRDNVDSLGSTVVASVGPIPIRTQGLYSYQVGRPNETMRQAKFGQQGRDKHVTD